MEPDDSEPKLPIVHKIGKYEVLSHQIGEGGFCCVYPCQHSSSSKTQVAMKLSLKRVEDCENDAKAGLIWLLLLMLLKLSYRISMVAVDCNQEGVADVSKHGIWQITGQSTLWHSSCVRM